MALDPLFRIDIASDRLSGDFVDETVYGTGGNPARADLRVFASGFKMNVDNTSTAIVLTSNTADPQTVTSWEFPYDSSSDGWWKFYWVAIPEYSGGTTYTQYQAVFDPSNDAVYQSTQNGNIGQSLANPVYWTLVTDPSSLADFEGEPEEATNITSFIYQRNLSANSQWAYGNLIGENCSCTDCDESDLIYDYEIFSLWLNGLIVADQRQEYMIGETLARRIQSKYISCTQ